MRRLTFGIVALLVLTTAGLAVAKGLDGTKSIRSVTGTFAATRVEARGSTKRPMSGETFSGSWISPFAWRAVGGMTNSSA